MMYSKLAPIAPPPNTPVGNGFNQFNSNDKSRRIAFTLAEVLITLGIIGVVAALTMPSIMANIQKNVLKNQLKKFCTNFYNGIKLVKANTNPDIECYYWDTGSLGGAICVETNEYGTCKKWTTEDGSPLPKDYNGMISECQTFDNELFNKVFKIVKYCENNALANGCVSAAMKGADKVKSVKNPDVEQDPMQIFSDINIKNDYPAYVLADGTIIVRYDKFGSYPIYLVDVNGNKGPNKWGYDIFTFELIGNKKQGLKGLKGLNYATESGGTESSKMFRNLFAE